MNDKFSRQAIAELISAQRDALALVVAAMSQQMNVEKLAVDLRAQIAAAEATKLVSPMAIEQAIAALAAVDAESALRRKGTH